MLTHNNIVNSSIIINIIINGKNRSRGWDDDDSTYSINGQNPPQLLDPGFWMNVQTDSTEEPDVAQFEIKDRRDRPFYVKNYQNYETTTA